MNPTRLLMSSSALFLGALGLLATFAPDWLLTWLGTPVSPASLLLTQVLGALWLGFAGLDWMARSNLIGGIYSRPVAIGNLMHFLVAGLAMIRIVAERAELRALWPIALLYVAFAAGFGLVLFRHPIPAGPSGDSRVGSL
jgi:hypothetical protein